MNRVEKKHPSPIVMFPPTVKACVYHKQAEKGGVGKLLQLCASALTSTARRIQYVFCAPFYRPLNRWYDYMAAVIYVVFWVHFIVEFEEHYNDISMHQNMASLAMQATHTCTKENLPFLDYSVCKKVLLWKQRDWKWLNVLFLVWEDLFGHAHAFAATVSFCAYPSMCYYKVTSLIDLVIGFLVWSPVFLGTTAMLPVAATVWAQAKTYFAAPLAPLEPIKDSSPPQYRSTLVEDVPMEANHTPVQPDYIYAYPPVARNIQARSPTPPLSPLTALTKKK
jgi:hypothetical protein